MPQSHRSGLALSAVLVLSAAGHTNAQNAEQDVRNVVAAATAGAYEVRDGAITAHNGTRYHNRPLYCNHMPAFVLAGDRPCVRLARDPYIYGCFMVGYARQGRAVWLHEAADRDMLYRPGRMEWRIADPVFAGTRVVLEVVPLADGAGMAVRLMTGDAKAGDRVVFAFGGAAQRPKSPFANVAWSLDPRGTASLQTRGFVPDDCAGDRVRIDGDVFVITPPAYEPAAKLPLHTVAGRCSATARLAIVDATNRVAWASAATRSLPVATPEQTTGKPGLPMPLGTTTQPAEPKLPMVCGAVDLQASENQLYWAIEGFLGDKIGERAHIDAPRLAFEAGMKRMEAVGRQVVVDTPDPRLNAVVAAVCHGLDGAWYPPVYVHGGMLWNVPFPGWRTLYGPTAFGWHDRVLQQAKYYISHQETADTKREPKAQASLGLGQEARDSRFYGKGHINQDQSFYNFQSVFFDMLIHAWHWTHDPELEKILRPALERHLEWQRECFDPDNDGLYESYINTWPTDSVWYAGGAGAEETAYAYNAHAAGIFLAQNEEAKQPHFARYDLIRKAFTRHFWIEDQGYVGCWIEQTGLKRLHTDSWLYSIFLPIDAGLLSLKQGVQALHYTEWGLQRVKSPLGGERCWTSNWVPSQWSTRVLYPGDNYHLALAYFKADLPEQGWDLLRGAAYESAYNSSVPGCVATSIGGTDFTDCTSMFARTVVEGLFGCGGNWISPKFPDAWDQASIRTPDLSMTFVRDGAKDVYRLHFAEPRFTMFTLPARSTDVSVSVTGEKSFVRIRPGCGRALVTVGLESGEPGKPRLVQDIEVVLTNKNPRRPALPISLTAQVDSTVELRSPGGEIVDYDDPQHALDNVRIEHGVIHGTAGRVGHNVIFGDVGPEKGRYHQVFRLEIADPQAERAQVAASVRDAPKTDGWQCIDVRPALNGDVRTIYKQQYVSPRPNTCSVRIGTDGYSPWTFYYWNTKPPQIDLTNVAGMLDKDGRLKTTQGVPFAWPIRARSASEGSGEKNIAFTSTWDNWPRSVRVPVGKSGDAAWFLVCGTTNPMQTRIANGEIRLVYADGTVDSLELVPPNNFWTLCPLGTADYDYKLDGFCLPKDPPATVQLGKNCRAMLLSRRLRPGVTLDRVELETLSPEVVIGLMGVTIMTGQ